MSRYKKEIVKHLSALMQEGPIEENKNYIQHGDVTTYQHCKNVVLVSCWLNHRLHLGADETSLAVGAFLHDF